MIRAGWIALSGALCLALTPLASAQGAPPVAPREWSYAEAGQKYVAAVAPINRVGSRVNRSDVRTANVKRYCTDLSRAIGTSNALLYRGLWPVSISQEIRTMVRNGIELRSIYNICRRAPTSAKALSGLRAKVPRIDRLWQSNSVSAGLIRLELGIE
jgi:hypothetical protein